MSDLNASFTFRLTGADKEALSSLAQRMGCDRGAVLRRMIRQRSFQPIHHASGCLTTPHQIIPVQLKREEE